MTRNATLTTSTVAFDAQAELQLRSRVTLVAAGSIASAPVFGSALDSSVLSFAERR